tara:strand:+ start:141 stop:1748 length:1608 start_codon:yes stop_codon:yes gene_type:complete
MNSFFDLCLVLDPDNFFSWHKKLLLKVLDENNVTVSVILISENINSTKNKHFFLKCKDKIFFLYKKIDSKIFKTHLQVDKKSSFRGLLNDTKVYRSNLKELSNFFTNNGKLNNTCAILNLTYFKLDNNIIDNLKYGIWEYNIGHNLNSNPNLNGIVEVLDKINLTPAYLMASISTSNKKKKIYESHSSTDKRSISRNLNSIYVKASSFPSRVLKILKEDKNYISNCISLEENEISKNLSFLRFLFLIARHYLKYIKDKIIDIFYINQWSLLYYDGNDRLLDQLEKYKKIIPPIDRFYADPFVIEKKGTKYIFIEEAKFKNMIGFISVIKINKEGEISTPTPILKKDYHLSYPFIFEDNNDYYLIPESAENNKISLYKCVSFPYEWDFVSHIGEDIKAYDSTLLKYNNKFWLFTNVVEEKGASSWDELHIYYSDDLHSENWLPHKKNPVISNARSARPAGRIFFYKDKFIRPSQNCSERYGYGLGFNEILTLNEYDYNEKKIKSIIPCWNKNIIGIHTVNSIDNFTIADAIIKSKK